MPDARRSRHSATPGCSRNAGSAATRISGLDAESRKREGWLPSDYPRRRGFNLRILRNDKIYAIVVVGLFGRRQIKLGKLDFLRSRVIAQNPDGLTDDGIV